MTPSPPEVRCTGGCGKVFERTVYRIPIDLPLGRIKLETKCLPCRLEDILLELMQKHKHQCRTVSSLKEKLLEEGFAKIDQWWSVVQQSTFVTPSPVDYREPTKDWLKVKIDEVLAATPALTSYLRRPGNVNKRKIGARPMKRVTKLKVQSRRNGAVNSSTQSSPSAKRQIFSVKTGRIKTDLTAEADAARFFGDTSDEETDSLDCAAITTPQHNNFAEENTPGHDSSDNCARMVSTQRDFSDTSSPLSSLSSRMAPSPTSFKSYLPSATLSDVDPEGDNVNSIVAERDSPNSDIADSSGSGIAAEHTSSPSSSSICLKNSTTTSPFPDVSSRRHVQAPVSMVDPSVPDHHQQMCADLEIALTEAKTSMSAGTYEVFLDSINLKALLEQYNTRLESRADDPVSLCRRLTENLRAAAENLPADEYRDLTDGMKINQHLSARVKIIKRKLSIENAKIKLESEISQLEEEIDL